jgi:hypothetical protein
MKESSLNELSDHERESCWWEMPETARFDGAGGAEAAGSVRAERAEERSPSEESLKAWMR